MATLKLVILKHKPQKDGSYKIRIAVSHKQKTAYISTSCVVDSLNQFSNGRVVRRQDASCMNAKLRLLLDKYQERLDALHNIGALACKQIKDQIGKVVEEPITIDYIARLYTQEQSASYGAFIERVRAHFSDFTKGDMLLVNITPKIIQMFSDFLHKSLSPATVGIEMRTLKTLINRAVKLRLVSYDIHPFCDYKIPAAPIKKSDIPVSDMQKILHYAPTEKGQILARDIFLLSFYLGGMNLIDMMSCDFSADTIEYVRQKTAGRSLTPVTITLPLIPQARGIIVKYGLKNGLLCFDYSYSYKNFARYIRLNIEKMKGKLSIPNLMFYSARKSFAQYAMELGIPDNVIDYCLGHSDTKRGVIRYYNAVRTKQAAIALSRVADYIEHPEEYAEAIEMNMNVMVMRLD